MPRKPVWTEGQDAQIRRLRTEGADWDVIAIALGLTRWAIVERAKTLGAERRSGHAVGGESDADRQPLPAGHPDSWGAINRGTALENVPFRTPGTIR